MDTRAIGVLDSGIGGLTSAKVLEEILPCEDIIYFGDSLRMPYGGRTREEICEMSMQGAAFLDSFNVKAILLACGSISSNAAGTLRASFGTPFVGVVEAACAEALRVTGTKKIGVIATPATIASGVYEQGLGGGVTVLTHACPDFARMVEEGHFRVGDSVAEREVARELSCFRGSGIDTLLLGCTHYPLLEDVIAQYLGGHIRYISAGVEAAYSMAEYLRGRDMLTDSASTGQRRWYTSGDTDSFGANADLFLGHHIVPEQIIL